MKISEFSESIGKIAESFDDNIFLEDTKTDRLINIGLSESKYTDISEAVYSGNIGVMEVMRFFMQVKKTNITLGDYVKQLSSSENRDDVRLGWAIIQQYLGVQLKGKEFGEKDPNVTEMATSGATSSANVSTIASNSKKKTAKRKSDGTIKNAIDQEQDLFNGNTIKRKKNEI